MTRRRKFDLRNQLALDFHSGAEMPSNRGEAVEDTRDRVAMKLIPNQLVTPERGAGKEQVFELFDKLGIPEFNQGRMMGFWDVRTYRDWCQSYLN